MYWIKFSMQCNMFSSILKLSVSMNYECCFLYLVYFLRLSQYCGRSKISAPYLVHWEIEIFPVPLMAKFVLAKNLNYEHKRQFLYDSDSSKLFEFFSN